MRKAKPNPDDDDILPEYDFSGGVRGKYFQRYREGCNLVLLDPDVVSAFPDATAVNEALRLLLKLARERVVPERRRGRRKPRRPVPVAPER